MESATTLSDRRPTGFPIGFNPKDLDDEEDADYDNVFDEKDEEITTKKEVEEEEVEDINDSSSSTESEPKPKSKGGVKFDTNVTEIEIEIEEF